MASNTSSYMVYGLALTGGALIGLFGLSKMFKKPAGKMTKSERVEWILALHDFANVKLTHFIVRR